MSEREQAKQIIEKGKLIVYIVDSGNHGNIYKRY